MKMTIHNHCKSSGSRFRRAAVLFGLAAALLLIMIFIESNKPQSQSKDALVRWFAILIISFVALELLNAFVFK